MNDCVDLATAKEIMGCNYIGPEVLRQIGPLSFMVPDEIATIPYSYEELTQKANDYLLIWGASRFADGSPVTIRNLLTVFGKDPAQGEPCFYNQDWYDKEDFINLPMNEGWYLIRKSVYEGSRAVQPTVLMQKYRFPNAISCVYSFFVTWFALETPLWYHDFVWCSDTDHNGDRIYVGKYNDVDGVNQNGFSIHRHLSLRPCYACID